MSLKSRKKAFDLLASRFKCERPAPLIAKHKIQSALFHRLQVATAMYMSKCLGKNEFILDENSTDCQWCDLLCTIDQDTKCDELLVDDGYLETLYPFSSKYRWILVGVHPFL